MSQFPTGPFGARVSGAPPTMPGPTNRPIEIPPEPGVWWFASEAWRLLWSDWPRVAGPWVVAWLITIAASMVPLAGNLAGIFLAPVFVSATHLAVRRWRGEQTQVSQMFELKNTYWPLVGQQLLVAIAIGAAAIPGGVGLAAMGIIESSRVGGGPPSSGAIVVMVLCALVAILGYVYVACRLTFAGLLYMDAPPGTLGALQAISDSWRVTAQWSWTLFGLAWVMLFAFFVSLLLLLVGGLLIGAPLIVASSAVCFAVMCPRSDSGRYCNACGYDMVHSPSGVCPECGTPMVPPPIPAFR